MITCLNFQMENVSKVQLPSSVYYCMYTFKNAISLTLLCKLDNKVKIDFKYTYNNNLILNCCLCVFRVSIYKLQRLRNSVKILHQVQPCRF